MALGGLARILYLGSGGQRAGAALGYVQESEADTVLIAADKGPAVYEFARATGLHLRTINALSGAVAVSFGYEGTRLVSITQGGQTTAVSPSGLSGPYGEVTAASPDGETDFWSQIQHGTQSMGFTYSAEAGPFAPATRSEPLGAGLLAATSDPNGGTWRYTFDARGALQAQADAGDGAVGVTRVDHPIPPEQAETVVAWYTTTLGTAGGKSFTHEVKRFADGRAERRIVTPDGETQVTRDGEGGEVGTNPWGGFTRRDAVGRFELSTPLPARLGSLQTGYRVLRPDPFDLLTVTGITSRTQWNGAATTTTVTAGQVVTTTPGGRTITTTIDAQGRPQAVALPGLPVVTVAYDGDRPTAISHGGRTVTFGYDQAFVSSVVDPLNRTVSLPRDANGWPQSRQDFGVQQFDYSYDANGNPIDTSSPQSGGYHEPAGYSPVDLVTSFTLPAGATTLAYTPDRAPASGASPYGALSFDAEGRLTAVGDTQYTYDGDGYLSGISSPDGTISYAYAGGATAPTAITTATTAGGIAGTVTIARNARMQATAIGVAGGPSVEITADADGVVTQVGELEIARSAAGFITATTLGGVSDTYTRNALGEPVTYTARFDGVELFHERYRRDAGGRITGKTVRIVNPDTGGRERYEVAYGYDAGGRLAAVQYNDEPVIEYAYDANNNLIGAPPAPSGSPTPAPTPPPQAALLYLHAAPPAVTPAAHAGAWTDTAARTPAALGLAPQGEITATSVGAADCDGPGGTPRRLLANVFVSPPLADAYTFTGAEPFALVLGVAQSGPAAAEETGPAAVASLWVMSAAGSERCVLAEDWALHAEPLAGEARGIEAHVTAGGAAGGCAGITAAPGDRFVLEVGVACAASSAAPLAAVFTRGGGGDPLTAGESPGSGACGLPGTLQLPPGLRLAGTPDAGACAPESTPIEVPSRKLLAVQIGAANQATAAALIEPDGTPRRYAYTYDAHGALDTRTELDEDGAPLPGTTTDYDYDRRGNLRRVALPDGRGITYFIDAANRRAGQRVVDAQGSELAAQRLLYLDGLKPLAELDASGAVQTFYVYGDRPNVPEYLIKTAPDPDTGQPTTTRYRLITDTLGSVRLVVDADSGAVVQRVDYDEHGNVARDQGLRAHPFAYAGGLHDAALTTVRFGARDYDGHLARWVSRDRIGFAGGDANIYAYSFNDPINGLDPTGLADGHHYVPKSVVSAVKNISPEARDVFTSAKTGPLEGKNLNQPGFNEPHRRYNSEVRGLLERYIQRNNIDPANMTRAQAETFVAKVRGSKRSAIKTFLENVEAAAERYRARTAEIRARGGPRRLGGAGGRILGVIGILTLGIDAYLEAEERRLCIEDPCSCDPGCI